MNYQVSISRGAEKEFLGLPVPVRERVKAKLLALESNPRPVGCKKLRDSDKYRIRVADYRVLYLIEEFTHRIAILSIGHRREIYR